MKNDVAIALGGVEYACTIGEATIGMGEGLYRQRLPVEHFNLADGLGNFLSVSADILHRGPTNRTGDTAEAFEPGATFFDRVSDKSIPVIACRDLKGYVIAISGAVAATK